MNAISAQLIPRIFASGQGARNPLTEAALVLAGIITNDSSDAALQSAVADVEANALASQNPAVWIAALLIDLSRTLTDWENRIIDLEINGGGGGGGGGTGTQISSPFQSSNNVLLDDTRGTVGDWQYDPSDPGFFYMKVDDSPDTWIEFSVGTTLHS